jgi:hypothetical protein
MTGWNVWAARGLFPKQAQMSRLRYKVTEREEQQDAEEDLENLVRCDLDSWVHLVTLLCIYDIWSIEILILLHYFEWSSTVFILLACFLNLQDIFKEWHLSLHSGIYPRQKSAFPLACPEEMPREKLFSSPYISEAFISAAVTQIT